MAETTMPVHGQNILRPRWLAHGHKELIPFGIWCWRYFFFWPLVKTKIISSAESRKGLDKEPLPFKLSHWESGKSRQHGVHAQKTQWKGYVNLSHAVSLVKNKLAACANSCSNSGPVLFWFCFMKSTKILARTTLLPLSHSWRRFVTREIADCCFDDPIM